jgi:hypothetical protein
VTADTSLFNIGIVLARVPKRAAMQNFKLADCAQQTSMNDCQEELAADDRLRAEFTCRSGARYVKMPRTTYPKAQQANTWRSST